MNNEIDSELNKSQSFLMHRRRLSSSISSDSFNNPPPPHLMITDVAMHFDDIDYFDEQNEKYNEKISMGEKISSYSVNDLWTLLIFLSILIPIISCLFSYIVDNFLDLCLFDFFEQKSFVNFLLCLAVSLTMAFSGCFLCSFYKDAEGSGIPELKATLASGISFYKFFSLRVLFAKILGLFFSLGSGLFVGREGPFVYISAAIAYNLSRFHWFRRLHSKKSFRKQILSTAGGIGLTATFGTPIGGCLYSIEILTTFFPVGAFWKTFFCSFICALVFRSFGEVLGLIFWANTNFITAETVSFELLSFMGLGIVCGLVGACHVKFIEYLLIFRKMIKNKQLFSRYLYTGFTCLLTIFISFYFWDFGIMTEKASYVLFNSEYATTPVDNWYRLLILIVLKLLVNALGVTCPLPTGIFIPLFFAGALLGRLYGIFAVNYLGDFTQIGRYSVVGAGALVSAVTHTLSMAIIALELTRDMSLLFPMLIGVITAYYVSKALTLSVYYIISDLKDLPFLPRTLKPEVYNRFVRDIMDMDFPFLTVESSFGDLALVLNHIKYKTRTIPIINEDSLELIGSVQSANLRAYLLKAGKKHLQGLNPKSSFLKPFSNQQKNFFKLLPEFDEELIPKDMQALFSIRIDQEGFWDRKIDVYDNVLCPDLSPFTIQDNISVPRAHYLFSMLGLQTVFVLNRGKLVGMMNICNFQDIQYNEMKETKEEKLEGSEKKSESVMLEPLRTKNKARKGTG